MNAIWHRDGGRCVITDVPLRSRAYSVHHRILGHRDDNRPSNLVLLAGHGTIGAHHHAHQHSKSWATPLGLIVSRHVDRAATLVVPVWYNQPTLGRVGWMLLDDDDGTRPDPSPPPAPGDQLVAAVAVGLLDRDTYNAARRMLPAGTLMPAPLPPAPPDGEPAGIPPVNAGELARLALAGGIPAVMAAPPVEGPGGTWHDQRVALARRALRGDAPWTPALCEPPILAQALTDELALLRRQLGGDGR